MCKPIAGNFVRPKHDCQVEPLKGSSGIKRGLKMVTVTKEMRAMVDEEDPDDIDSRILLFELENGGTLRAKLPCSMLKGVEL